MMVVAVKMVFNVVRVASGGAGAIGDDFAALGDRAGVNTGHQDCAIGDLTSNLHDAWASGGDVDGRRRGLTAVAHPALGIAEGDHLAGHQFLHGDDGVPHLPNGGGRYADCGGGTVASSDPDLHPSGGQLGDALGGGGDHGGMAGRRVGHGRGHIYLVGGHHGGGHADKAVPLKELRVKDAHAVEARVLALLDEIGYLGPWPAGRHTQVYFYGHGAFS